MGSEEQMKTIISSSMGLNDPCENWTTVKAVNLESNIEGVKDF